jgi:hypothetical protein
VIALATIVAGYVIFVASMGRHELAVGRSESGVFGSAMTYGAFPVFLVAIPAFALLTLTDILRASHRRASEVAPKRP